MLLPVVMLATVLVYRAVPGEHNASPIGSAMACDYAEWLDRSSRERIAREEAWWKARGVWPPPKDE